jgi:hypothetical protein
VTKLYLYIAGFLAVMLFWMHYQGILLENKALAATVKIQKRTIAALDERDILLKQAYEEEREILDEIRNTPEDQDGPIAPVLRNTIKLLSDP